MIASIFFWESHNGKLQRMVHDEQHQVHSNNSTTDNSGTMDMDLNGADFSKEKEEKTWRKSE